ncbi:hypothetical protein FA13DRAFT_1706214 [Coprinellus micaceus]|uniref:Uncharacterized protein n=1 Tax=Coprinellus micaceus TaxID=71717 RepID=A0A4Y7TSA4_COPMI|nr:hypothetical protein FA13DRAFT_1706214 [Coprinellus micaceus]
MLGSELGHLDSKGRREVHHEAISQLRGSADAPRARYIFLLCNPSSWVIGERSRRTDITGERERVAISFGVKMGSLNGVCAEGTSHLSRTMGTSSSDVVILFVDLVELPLASLISSVAEELANIDGDSISIYVISDTEDHPIDSIIERIALHAVLSLIRDYVHQIDELLVQTEYLSSLRGVWRLVEWLSPSVADRTTLYYRANNIWV